MSKLGIIGCGWIVEKAYLPLIAKMNDVDISAVFDIDYHKAHKLQDKYCIPNIFDNIDCFLSSPLDAVIVATPNNTHTYYSDMALNAGKHVLCEKPVAFSKNDIEIEVSWIRKAGIPRPGTWITNKAAAGGGVTIDIGTHVIDIGLRFLVDKRIQSVKCVQGTAEQVKQNGAQWNTNNDKNQQQKIDVETWAKGEILFVNGAILRFNVDWSSDVNEDITSIKAIGDNGKVMIHTLFGFSNNFTRENIVILYEGMNGEYEKALYPMHNTFALDAFRDMVRYFIDATNKKTSRILQPSDSIYVVDAIEQLYKSI